MLYVRKEDIVDFLAVREMQETVKRDPKASTDIEDYKKKAEEDIKDIHVLQI